MNDKLDLEKWRKYVKRTVVSNQIMFEYNVHFTCQEISLKSLWTMRMRPLTGTV